MAQDRDPLDADAPREPCIPFRIVADGLEDGRVHHAAAAELDPARFLAHRAACAVALPAAEIDLGARLRIREKTRAKAHADARRKHLARERQERPLQVSEGDSLSDGQTLDLSE